MEERIHAGMIPNPTTQSERTPDVIVREDTIQEIHSELTADSGKQTAVEPAPQSGHPAEPAAQTCPSNAIGSPLWTQTLNSIAGAVGVLTLVVGGIALYWQHKNELAVRDRESKRPFLQYQLEEYRRIVDLASNLAGLNPWPGTCDPSKPTEACKLTDEFKKGRGDFMKAANGPLTTVSDNLITYAILTFEYAIGARERLEYSGKDGRCDISAASLILANCVRHSIERQWSFETQTKGNYEFCEPKTFVKTMNACKADAGIPTSKGVQNDEIEASFRTP
jgi:hypothetical protein